MSDSDNQPETIRSPAESDERLRALLDYMPGRGLCNGMPDIAQV